VQIPGGNAGGRDVRRRPPSRPARAAHGNFNPLPTFDDKTGATARRAWLVVREHGPILARYTPRVSDAIPARLLRWFHTSRRDLPWRTPFPRDPYAVLVSEVMLQQTQVDRVRGPYLRFMDRYPSVAALAAATDEDVALAFSGLGYYRRVRLLHAAARAIVAEGGFPESREALARLHGFGPYTSAAVAAFAFAGSDPPVDGNIARVTGRVRALDLALGSPSLLRAGTEFAASLHAQLPTPEVWEALMELGAVVCTPRSPRCPACPLAAECRAFALGRQHAFPRPRRRRARERHAWVALWLERADGRVLLRRVSERSLLGGMWLPPFVPLAQGADQMVCARTLAEEAGFAGVLSRAPSIKHTITYRDITVYPFAARLPGLCVAEPRPEESWQRPDAPQVATSSMLNKLATACRSALTPSGGSWRT
jgi:A/G-specific adenine glycosylase